MYYNIIKTRSDDEILYNNYADVVTVQSLCNQGTSVALMIMMTTTIHIIMVAHILGLMDLYGITHLHSMIMVEALLSIVRLILIHASCL